METKQGPCEMCMTKECELLDRKEENLDLRVEQNKLREELRQERKKNSILLEQMEEQRLKEELREALQQQKPKKTLRRTKSTLEGESRTEVLLTESRNKANNPRNICKKEPINNGRKNRQGEERTNDEDKLMVLQHGKAEPTESTLENLPINSYKPNTRKMQEKNRKKATSPGLGESTELGHLESMETENPATQRITNHQSNKPTFAEMAKKRLEERKPIPKGIEALKEIFFQPPAPRRPQSINKVVPLYFRNIRCGPIGELRYRMRQAGIATSHILEIAFLTRSTTEMIVNTEMAETVCEQLAKAGFLRIMNYNPLASLTRIQDAEMRERIRRTFQSRMEKAAERITNVTTRQAFLEYSNSFAAILNDETVPKEARLNNNSGITRSPTTTTGQENSTAVQEPNL